MTGLCVGKPAEWWSPEHDGARLALGLCSVCPGRPRCLDGDPRPHGVIRAGIAWTDDGRPLPVCPCGYPDWDYRGGPTNRVCPRCRIPDVPIPDRLALRRRRVITLAARMSDGQIADRLGVSAKTVRVDRIAAGLIRRPGVKAVAP